VPPAYAADAAGARQALAKSARDTLPPAEVGYYMDVLHGRLKQLTGHSIGVGRQVNIIVIVLTGVGFEQGSSQFNPALRETLTRLSTVFVEYRKTTIAVRVRGDDAGAQGSNPQLAEQRRLAVADFLAAAGVSDKRIIIAGAAPSRAPAARARAANPLRLELRLEPIVAAADNAR
jgi:outer membrane protein OmpA-like peptidoglycan-associated protein